MNFYKELTPVVYGENLVKILAGVDRRAGALCFNMHWHERMELLRIHSGCLQVDLGKNILEARAGELVIINPCQPHHGISLLDNTRYDVIMFDLQNLNNDSIAYHKYLKPIEEGDLVFSGKTNHPDILQLADAIISGRTDTSPLRVIGLIYQIMDAFYRCCAPSVPAQSNTRKHHTDITRYINEHFSEPISTASLSREFSYSEAYFSRKFKRETGISVTTYIRILRLEYARKLLESSSGSVLSIALQSGFSDIYYFTHCFKTHYGVSPRVYREQRKKPIAIQ